MSTNCNPLNGIPKGCADDFGLGGILRAFVFDMENIETETLNNATMKVDSLVLDVNAAEYTFKKNTSLHVTTPNIDLINGSTYYTHVVSFIFSRRKASKSVELQLMAEGQRYLGIVYKDANNQWWYIKDAQLTGGDEQSGRAKADGSLYNVELTAETEKRAYEMDDTDALELLSQVS